MDYRRELPSLSALSAFECAARHNNFTRAAKELSTSQPAISRHIDNLEDWLGTSLFFRSHNRLKLTPAGHRLQKSLILGFEEIRSAIREISEQCASSRFTIGCTYDVAHCWLMPQFNALKQALPGKDIHVVTLPDLPTHREFGADMMVCGGMLPIDGFDHARLLTERVTPVCSPAFFEAHKEILTAGDAAALAALPLIHLNKENHGWTTWSAWFAAQGVVPEGNGQPIAYNNYVYVLDAAMAGEGLALGWKDFITRPISRNMLQVAFDKELVTEFGFFAAWPTDSDELANIETVIDCLCEK